MKFSTFTAGSGGLALSLLAALSAHAQIVAPSQRFNIGNAVRQGEESRQTPIPGAQETPVLPQLNEPQLTFPSNETLLVQSFEVDAPDPIDDPEMRALLTSYENRKLTLAEIYEAADKITNLYRTRGYLVAKAYVPAQDARSGVLKIKLVMGKYGAVTIDNKSLVNEAFLKHIVDNALADPSVRSAQIERAMLLVSDLPGSAMPRVAIGPGRQPETADFVFSVPQSRMADGYLLGDNYGSPLTGRGRVTGGVDLNSPFGFADKLSAFGVISGTGNLVNGRIAYDLPIGYGGLTAEIAAYKTTYTLGGIYRVLNATGTADAVSGTLTYPLIRQRDQSVYLSGNFTHRALVDKVFDTSLADRSTDAGTVGVSANANLTIAGLPLTTSAAVSLTQGYLAFSNSSQSAVNVAGPDTGGNYTKLNFAFTGSVALIDNLTFATNVKAQRSLSGNLDSSEQFGLTGYWGVRSYDEGLSGDSGYVVTPELRYALPDVFSVQHSIGVFTDLGGASLSNASFTTLQKSYTQLNDVGVGYYANLQYMENRFVVLKAELAHSYGSVNGAQSYNRGTKALLQGGVSF